MQSQPEKVGAPRRKCLLNEHTTTSLSRDQLQTIKRAILAASTEEEVEMLERERGRPRSSNDILHSMNNVNTLSNLSKLSGWGLSKSYNHSSVVSHIAAAPSIAQIKICQDTDSMMHTLAFFKS